MIGLSFFKRIVLLLKGGQNPYFQGAKVGFEKRLAKKESKFVWKTNDKTAQLKKKMRFKQLAALL
jgi:hypothetical protein